MLLLSFQDFKYYVSLLTDMLFLSSRVRNTAVSGVIMRDQSYTNKMGHSFIICGCLLAITGLILIVVGAISEVKKTTIFIGIGVISLGIGFFLTTLVFFYGKLDICYNNWAYRSRVLPTNIETPRPIPTIGVLNSPLVDSSATIQKQIETPAPITAMSGLEIHKVVIAPSIQIGSTTINNPDHVT
jgi:hypothetical protein